MNLSTCSGAVLRVLVACCVSIQISSCSAFDTYDCNDIGCVNRLALSLRTADGRWEDGQYDLNIEGDFSAGSATCRFRAPDDIPALGSVAELDCTDSWSFSLEQDSDCSNPLMKPRNQEPCVPLAGQFAVSGWFEGTPKKLTISLVRDGATIDSQTIRPDYKQSRPGGADCELVCTQADESITFR